MRRSKSPLGDDFRASCTNCYCGDWVLHVVLPLTTCDFSSLYFFKKCFGLLPTKLGCFEPYVTKNILFSSLCLKYVAFSFIAGKTCFGLFAVTVGCSQRCCNGKRFSPSLQRVTLIFFLILLNETFSSLSG